MHQPRRLRLTASILLCFVLQALGADKYTDENRPYEFGFKIDGQQHRHESKDKDGIVMGEFGFVTADDVYHVTVYATDKEGRFKILSMKNIHLKSTARQGHALALPFAQPSSVQASAVLQQTPKQGGVSTPSQPASVQASVVPQQPPKQGGLSILAQPASVQASAVPQQPLKQGGLSTPAQLRPFTSLAAPVSQGSIAPQLETPYKPVSIEPPGRSCSSCSLPTTTTRAPPPAFNQGAENNNYNSPNRFGPPSPPSQNQQAFPPFPPGQQNIAQPRQQSFPPSSPEQQNIAQGGPKSQNIPQQGLVAPNSASSFAAQPGPNAQIYSSPPIYSQGPVAFLPSSPEQQNIAQVILKSQNIPQQGLVAPNSASSFAAQPGLTAQIYPNPPSYSQGPVASNAPNNYKLSRRPSPSVGPTQGGAENQATLFGGNDSPYPATPDGFASPILNSQNNGQQAGLFRPDAQPNGQTPTDPQGPRERTAKQYNVPPQGPRGSAKPTLVSAQMQIVDKNTNIHALGPNEQKGLPPGLTEGDMTQLLYTFNYTLGFHGHFEEGYTNGVKKGYYFVTGRNGVRTRIDYVADDAGFHPKVSQDILDLLSEDVPKPETEKDEKYGLKGYEFKWLYYPVESKRR